MLTGATHCAECGAAIPAGLHGVCPRCLLDLGAESTASQAGAWEGGRAARFFPFQFGGYRVVRMLGRGGMGEVYEADELATGRRVALKMLDHAIDSAETRKRFLREGRLAAAVNHPNSVYIFGTEEIEATPVIVMELVEAGTLRDELERHGPMPVRAAVDAILQAIAGLEASAAAGVLHRDVKPANCFLTPDGKVKVGDFGLSISTDQRMDTQLTAPGAVLGTLAYASPEQLSGSALDLRADIYSVGATLYALLTGHAPFESDNAVQVITAVVNAAPPPLSKFRPDVPSGLALVLARAMAKKREERFPNYGELHAALVPFSSAVPQPAPLGLRLLAGTVDEIVAWTPGRLIETFLLGDLVGRWLAQPTWAAFLPQIPIGFLYLSYYAVPEGMWGASCGKALCGLRVVGADRSAPGVPRALVRAICWLLPAVCVELGVGLVLSPGEYASWRAAVDTAPMGFGLFYIVASSVLSVLLFSTIRRSNGLAAVQDLVSGTRVVVREEAAARPRLQPLAPLPTATGDRRLGPYRMSDPERGAPFATGYDEVLQRHVWLCQPAAGAPPVSAMRRAIHRPSRLRWLGGVRSEVANWDAFEAPPGRPFAALAPRSQAWAAVRHWLLDLAVECESANQEGVLPAAITSGHVWIVADGGAMLLDEAWQEAPGEAFAAAEPAGAQAFLHALAQQVLDPSTLPGHARDFLARLAAGAAGGWHDLALELQSLCARPAEVSPRRRVASLMAVPAFFMLFWFPGTSTLPDLGLPPFRQAQTQIEQAAPGAVVIGGTPAPSAGKGRTPNYYSTVLRWLLPFFAVLQLASVLVFRVTPGQGLWSFLIVDRLGQPASRLRMLARWAVAWLPVGLAEAIVGFSLWRHGALTPLAIAGATFVLLLWIGGLVAAILHPTRGPHDRIAGTWLVPR